MKITAMEIYLHSFLASQLRIIGLLLLEIIHQLFINRELVHCNSKIEKNITLEKMTKFGNLNLGNNCARIFLKDCNLFQNRTIQTSLEGIESHGINITFVQFKVLQSCEPRLSNRTQNLTPSLALELLESWSFWNYPSIYLSIRS